MTRPTLNSTDDGFARWAEEAAIGERIRWLLEVRGYKQTQIAGKLGITQAAVSNWITGESRKPNAHSLLALAEAISANPFWVMHGVGSPFVAEPKPEDQDIPNDDMERTLINAFRKMGADAKAAFMAVGNALVR